MQVMDDSEGDPVDPGAYDDDLEEEGALILVRQVPLGVVFARIVVVSGMGITGALAIVFLIGLLWWPAWAPGGGAKGATRIGPGRRAPVRSRARDTLGPEMSSSTSPFMTKPPALAFMARSESSMGGAAWEVAPVSSAVATASAKACWRTSRNK